MGNRWAISGKAKNLSTLPEKMTAAQFREMIAAGSVKQAEKPTKTRRIGKVDSPGEATLAQALKALKIAFIQEYKFCPSRKWRADFHITGTNLLIEVEGGVRSQGRHVRPQGYINDTQKYNEAAKLGFIVLRFDTETVSRGTAINEIEAYLMQTGYFEKIKCYSCGKYFTLEQHRNNDGDCPFCGVEVDLNEN